MSGRVGMTRRPLVLGGFWATASAAYVAACGGPEQAKSEAPAAPAAGAPVALLYWSQRGPQDRLGLGPKAALDDYQAKNPGKVTLEIGEGGAALSMEKIKTAIAGGTPPNLYGGLYQAPAADLFALGALLDINAELRTNKEWAKNKADLIPQTLDGCTWKGKLAMMPMMLAQQVLGINKHVLARVGVPLPPHGFTWNDFLDLGRKVAEPPDRVLFPFNYTWSALMSWLFANGLQPMNKERTKLQYDTPQMVETVQWLHDQVTKGIARNGASQFNDGGSVTESVNEAAAAQPPRFPNVDPGDGSGIHITHFPFGPSNTSKVVMTYANNYGLVVLKPSDARKAALSAEIAGWAARPDVQVKIAEASGHPASSLTAAKPENLARRIKDNVILSKINEFGRYSQLTPNFPNWTAVGNILSENLKRVANGELRPRDALADAQQKMQPLIDEDLKRG
ncbi:MAG: extracellular solute-binding protein [Chloroflexi bacterium]|nr:extracellular solute-binding protein [Chloroflexota bacterium]